MQFNGAIKVEWQCVRERRIYGQYERGAMHRIYDDTPPLGGNCGETWGRSGGTCCASER